VQDDLWEFIARGALGVEHVGETMHSRCREMMNKYHDLPMDLADATLVALGEERKLKKIFTLDYRHLSLYKPRHTKRFTLIPSISASRR
jgi:predicted nucleic acid-binding protein